MPLAPYRPTVPGRYRVFWHVLPLVLATLGAVLVLVAFGMYLGRYLRFNSWDLRHPVSFVKKLNALLILVLDVQQVLEDVINPCDIYVVQDIVRILPVLSQISCGNAKVI